MDSHHFSTALTNVKTSVSTTRTQTHLNMAVVKADAGEAGVVQALRLLRTYWALLIPVALVLRFFYYKYASPLRNYPGPFLASGSRAWKGMSTTGQGR